MDRSKKMKSPIQMLKGCALVAVVCLAGACNPFEGMDPTSTSTAGHSASNDMCAVNKNLGRCPPPPPKDFIY
jgi:hypothetical protein